MISVEWQSGHCTAIPFSHKLSSNGSTHSIIGWFLGLALQQIVQTTLLPKGKNSSVVVSTGRFKVFDWFVLNSRCFPLSSDPGTSSDSQVCTQPKPFPQGVIDQRLDRLAVEHRWLNYLIGIVASIRKRLQCCLNFGNLFRSRLKLASQRQSWFQSFIL